MTKWLFFTKSKLSLKLLLVFAVGVISLKADAKPKNPHLVVTLAEYQRIQIGMSESDVESIAGDSWEGVAIGCGPDGSFLTFSHRNPDNSHMEVTIKAGEGAGVVGKSQTGLH